MLVPGYVSCAPADLRRQQVVGRAHHCSAKRTAARRTVEALIQSPGGQVFTHAALSDLSDAFEERARFRAHSLSDLSGRSFGYTPLYEK